MPAIENGPIIIGSNKRVKLLLPDDQQHIDSGCVSVKELSRYYDYAHNGGMKPPTDPAIEEALHAGFDLNLIEINLLLTPEERWRQHDMALEVVLELEKARMVRDAKLQEAPRATR